MSEHGTRSRYNSGCRCDECRKANREYERSRTMRKTAEECGAPAAMVEAAPVRRRLLELYERDYSQREICRLTGLSRSALNGIVRAHPRTGRPVEMVRRETKDAIFAIKGRRSPSPGQRIDAEWMVGWLNEYRASGMSMIRMSKLLDIDYQTICRLTSGRTDKVEGATFHAFVKNKPACDRAMKEMRI